MNWEKQASAWCKTDEITLGDPHKVDRHVVAGAQRQHNFANPDRGTGDGETVTPIDIAIVRAGNYPTGTFDPATLTNGADVLGF